jgi:iron(III) transport system permease protein
MRRWPSTRTIVATIGAVLFAACCLLPIAYLVSISLSSLPDAGSGWSLDARQQGLLWNTTVLGLGTALLATAIGTPLGLALARVPLRGKPFLRVALAVPVLLPPYIVALAWTYLDFFPEWTYSLFGAIVVMSLVFYPLSMLATEVALRRIDGRFEEAAVLVARPGVVLRRITLPLAAPSIVAAALIIFVLSVSEFGVPGLLRVRVYTTEVFTAFAALYDFTRAIVLSLPLLILCVIVATVAVALFGERLVSGRRVSGMPPVLLDTWRRPAGGAAIAVLATAVGVPVIVLVREALGAESLLTVFEGSSAAIANSLLLAVIGATAVVTVAAWPGYARARARTRMGRWVDALFIVVFAVPSTIVGVGLIGLWNRPGTGVVYGTDAMFIIGYLARFVPVAALAIAAATRYVPISHEEAASVSGAGFFRTMTRIVIPQIRHGLVTAWVIAFVLAFGELGVSVLIAPPGEATLPIRIYTIIANTPPSHVAALALLQTTVILVPVAFLAGAVAVQEAR